MQGWKNFVVDLFAVVVLVGLVVMRLEKKQKVFLVVLEEVWEIDWQLLLLLLPSQDCFRPQTTKESKFVEKSSCQCGNYEC
jgi:hypothetical protein